jgi:hypothetical protein
MHKPTELAVGLRGSGLAAIHQGSSSMKKSRGLRKYGPHPGLHDGGQGGRMPLNGSHGGRTQ